MQLILGSQSPRRREVLNFFDIPFKQVTSDYDEEAIPFQNNPTEYVQILSQGKAETLAPQYSNQLILTADTIVYKDAQIYGKPKDSKEAFDRLKELSGHWHSVFTGLTLFCKGQYFNKIEETKVRFNSLNDEQIKAYCEKLSVSDKAGGYMIQGPGGLIVNRIEGCYYNVLGLPLNALCEILSHAGIDLWKHLKRPLP